MVWLLLVVLLLSWPLLGMFGGILPLLLVVGAAAAGLSRKNKDHEK